MPENETKKRSSIFGRIIILFCLLPCVVALAAVVVYAQTARTSQVLPNQNPPFNQDPGRNQAVQHRTEFTLLADQRAMPHVRTTVNLHGLQHERLDQQTTKLLNTLRGTRDKEQREHLKDQLQESVAQEFDRRHETQADEIRQVEERLRRLREVHQQREENKERIVQRRVHELIGQPDIYQWNYQLPAGTQNQPAAPALNYPVETQYRPMPIGIPGPPHLPSE